MGHKARLSPSREFKTDPKAKPVSPQIMSTLSEYERQRLENIKRNQQVLASLNISPLVGKPVSTQGPALPVPQKHLTRIKEANKKAKEDPSGASALEEAPRRSARIHERALEQVAARQGGGKRTKKEPLMSLENLQATSPVQRPKAVIGPIPFNPQIGATEDFLETMKCVKDEHEGKHLDNETCPSEWEIALPHCITKVFKSRIYSLAIHPSTQKTIVAVGGKMGELAIWDATPVTDVLFDPDRALPSIATLVEEHEAGALQTHKFDARLSSYADFEPHVFTFQPHKNVDSGSISSLHYFSHREDALVSTSYDGSIRAMNLTKGVFDDLYNGEDWIYSLSPQDDNVWWFSHGAGQVSCMDTRQPTRPHKYDLHEVKIGSISVSQTNHLLCTASNDRTIAIWDTQKFKGRGLGASAAY